MKRLDYHSLEGKCRNRRRGEGVRCGSEEGGRKRSEFSYSCLHHCPRSQSGQEIGTVGEKREISDRMEKTSNGFKSAHLLKVPKVPGTFVDLPQQARS